MSRESPGTVTTSRSFGDTIEMVVTRRLTGAQLEAAWVTTQGLLEKRGARWCFIDATSMTTFDSGVRAAAVTIFKGIMVSGLQEALVATSSAAARMLGSAVAFATGTPVRFFATRQDALEYMARHRH